jgi:hypothetical protein
MARVNMNVDPNESSIQPIPEGRYLLTVKKVEEGTSKSGRPQAILHLSVEEGPFAGRKLGKHWVTFIPKGEPGHGLTVSALRAFGLLAKGETVFDGDTDDFDTRSAYADVVIDGKYNAVDKWISPESAGDPPAPAKTAAAPKPAAQSRKNEEVPF